MTSSATRPDAAFYAWAAEQPTSCSCLYCDWCFEGSAGECRAAHTAHRLAAHPALKPKRRRRTNLARFTKSRPDDYAEGAVKHAAEVAAMWAKREIAYPLTWPGCAMIRLHRREARRRVNAPGRDTRREP